MLLAYLINANEFGTYVNEYSVSEGLSSEGLDQGRLIFNRSQWKSWYLPYQSW